MGPEAPVNFTFGGGANFSNLNPIVGVGMAIALLFILFGPRKYIPLPFLFSIFLGSVGQQLYIGGFHFYVLRILVIAGMARVIVTAIMSKEPTFVGGFTAIDKLFLGWIVYRCLANIILNNFATGAVTYQISSFVDWTFGYFFVRYMIREEEDAVRVIKVFALLALIFSITMTNEKFGHQNVFGYLGVLSVVPGSREGSIRATGAFAHPILSGVFAVAVLPLFWYLWKSGKAKALAFIGCCGSMGMMFMSASSTPLLQFMAAVCGYLAWPFRDKMRIVRWGIVLTLITLHLVMKAPVWMLINRIDLVAGNSGYHRAMLIDQCIRHFWDWWLVGTNAAGTWGWDLWDTSNQFVQEAESGGLIAFMCFVLIISRAFRRLYRARKIVQAEGDTQRERLMWILAITLFTNCIGFFGISYFDHTKIMWFAFLSIVIAVTTPILATEKVPEPEPIRPVVALKPAYETPELAPVARRLPATKPAHLSNTLRSN